MRAVVFLLTSQDFQLGLVAGIAGLAVVFALRKRHLDWGLVWGASVLLGLVLAGRYGWFALGQVANQIPWGIPAGVVAAAAGAFGVWKVARESFAGPAVALSIAGIWATVPDTERVSVLIGVTAAMLWAWWPTKWSSPRLAGAVVIGLFSVWIAMVGGIPRDTGLLGGLGSVASLGLSAYFVPRTRPVVWLLAHAALVVAWSRLAGLSESLGRGIAIGLVASIAVAVVGAMIERLLPPRAAESDAGKSESRR